MASTRYGRIYHGDHHHNNIKFPSPGARDLFTAEFKKYHDSHEHDGEAPRFEFIKAADVRDVYAGGRNHNHGEITIDGYAFYEIKEYHNRENPDTYTHYRVPTCCISPIIVLDREFIDAGTLKRHELSSVFGDMPETDFENLVKSVEQDGFMDSLIRVLDGKVLDGWHRYQAALSLNLVRKLMFMPWDDEKDGKAIAFVSARNLERRHLTASQRGQIVVFLNERFGWGGDRSKTPDDALKTKADLAAEANVGASTIDRAVKVEKLGKSEAVISGEKTASQVIKEETLKSLWEQVSAEMPEWKRRNKEKSQYESDHIGRASQSMLIAALRFHKDSDADGAATVVELKQLLELIKADTLSFIIEVRRVLKESQQPVESKSETADDRDASKLLKKKKQTLKSMWDARVQAARDYTGDADTELNQYLSLPQLEDGFARYHEVYEAPFKSGMKRITSANSLSNFQERALESDVSLEDLEKECRAINTYAFDILKWKDQEWIQSMLQWRKNALSKADSKPEPKPDPEPEPDDDLKTLWEKVTAEMPKWKQRYKEIGYKESDLVSRASKSQLIRALGVYRESETSGAVTVEELKDLLKLMKSDSYVFIRRVRDELRDTEPPEPEPSETSDASDETPAETEETCPDDAQETEDSEVDTSLADLNLPSLKGILDTLLDTVGRIEHSITRDDLSVAVYEAFDEYEGITEREQVSILLDCAHTIIAESESYPHP